jgi:hypothetical protein
MITRENLNGLSPQEIQDLLDANLQEYAVNVLELQEEENILEKEQEVIKLMEENDIRMKLVTYKLADEVNFDGQVYKKETVQGFIADLLDTQEVEWSYTLGLYEMMKVWKNKELQEIQYHAYDSTLRVLGGLKYKGFMAWKKILTINEFLSSCHEEYTRDYAYIVYLSQIHNTLLEALKKFNPVEEETKDQSE